MPVLERAREEDLEARRLLLQLRAVVAEADDHRSRVLVRATPRAAPARPCSRSACRSRRLSAGRPRGTRRVAPGSPRPGASRSALPGFGGSSRASATSRSSACALGAGCHSSMSTPRGISCTLSTVPHISRTTLRMCSLADYRLCRAFEHLAAPHRELLVPAHLVLELRAVRLDYVRRAVTAPTVLDEQHMVDEESSLPVLVDRRRIRLHPRVELSARAVLHALHLVPLVAVEHEDRQQPADVRPDRLRATEVEPLGLPAPARRPSRRGPAGSTRRKCRE